MSEAPLLFEPAPDATKAERLVIDVGGWEGPLDLLLTLARGQKVDLREISILELVDQYLNFIRDAKQLRLELAADYLVMAAWLAYLKSGLLLPRPAEIDPDPEELALRLQLRLQRLDAMREGGARLMARDRLGRDVFLRAAPEGIRTFRKAAWDASLFDLISAYGQVRARAEPPVHLVRVRHVMPLDEAIERVGRLVGAQIDWVEIASFLPAEAHSAYRRSALASSFVAALELARTGKVELAQDGAFAPLMLRKAQTHV